LHNPWAFIKFDGFISMSNSCNLANQLAHVPYVSCWDNIILIGGYGT
jgi:hypothetical protein